jgi:hypothetical protein
MKHPKLTVGGISGSQLVIETDSSNPIIIRRGANTSSPAQLGFNRTRNTVATSHTVLQANDQIGAVRFLGSDGTGFIETAEIHGEVDGTPGTNDMPGRIVFGTTPNGTATAVERVLIGNDGGLAIQDGITAPATRAGWATLYVDTADGDLKVKFGDGTVKTIVVDT